MNQVERMTGLPKFGQYMVKMLTIDALFLNEDRHTHNIAVLMDGEGNFDYCPIFDNGAGLLSDTTMDYPLGSDIYSLIESVQAKTICTDIDEQLDVAEKLYGNQLKFCFTKKDVSELLSKVSLYSSEEKSRVERIIFERMRKYQYLFGEK